MWRIGALILLVAAVLAGATALAVDARDDPPRRLSPHELQRTQDRIDRAWHALERRGIFVQSTGGPPSRCVTVELLNPSPPNVEYVERHFGPGVCVSRKPALAAYACTGYDPPRVPEGPVVVPDVRGLTLYGAEKRLAALGLAWAIDCPGDHDRRPRRPSRFSVEASGHVTHQCPHPGEPVQPGEVVRLDAAANLPGGFTFRFGTLGEDRVPNACRGGRYAPGG